MEYPKTPKKEVKEMIHGTEIVDEYQWLEEDTKEVQNWIQGQNAFTRSYLDKIPVREKIKQRLNELYRIDTVGTIVPRQGRYFFTQRKKDEELFSLYVQEGLYGTPRLLINANSLSEDKTTILQGNRPSQDGKLLCYGISEAGNDQASIHIMNVDTGEKLPDTIPADIYPTVRRWHPDNTGFYYSRRHPDAPKGEEKFHKKLYFHKLGDNFENDQMIFGNEMAKEDMADLEISQDGRYIFITVYILSEGQRKSKLYLQDNQKPEKGFFRIGKKMDARPFGIMHRGKIYLLTNHEAPRWKLIATDADKAGSKTEEWKTLVPESNHVLEEFTIIKDRIFIETYENACSKMTVHDLNGKLLIDVQLPTLGTITRKGSDREGNELFLTFNSFLIPNTVYRFDIETGKQEIFKKTETSIDTNAFTVKQIWYQSKDGTKIPMFLVHKKELSQNGDNPTMLYGYGGFNISSSPRFNQAIIPFLENDGVYAMANIRGGGEFGEQWYEDGILDKKQNSYDDFIAAAEWLIENKYTNPQRLAISGWSNGGLLVGAVMTQKPEIFKAVIMGAPVLDMLRFHLFHGGRIWMCDYGSAENPEQFKTLLQYSPYHNIEDKEQYPATLIVTADKDDRVHPLHAFKMAAKLQELNTSENPILLRVETKAGHSGALSTQKGTEQFADIWSFIFWQLKMAK